MTNHHKYSSIDFSNHEYIKHSTDVVDVYILKRPDSDYTHLVQFIVSKHETFVTGDFGKYVFDRAFHPHKDESVSEGYWIDNLTHGRLRGVDSINKYVDQNATTQNIMGVFKEHILDIEPDDETVESLNEIADELCNIVYDRELSDYVGCKLHDAISEYESQLSGFLNWENVDDLIELQEPAWLYATFDAFNEMCKREGETK